MRKIPATMATQHPDHAATPYWHHEPFIHSSNETKELFLAFSELGITEYKWDWEGKLVDESVLERLFAEYFEFFKDNPLGQQRFLTFRLPNPKVETEFRLGRAFINLASAASVAKHFGLPTPPLFEVILPMTQTPEEMLAIQEAFQQTHALTHPLYKLEHLLTNLRIIPLFEEIHIIMNSDEIIKKYLAMYKKIFKKLPPYFRPYVARSDPALNAGIVPTVLAIKIALSRYEQLSKKLNIPFYPIIGAAALPFRGGISPETVKEFADEYQGIRTTTIQSAFRYDYPKKDVIKAIQYLEENLSKHHAVIIPAKEEKELRAIIPIFENSYKEIIEAIAPLINQIAGKLPKRRERVQHTGLFGYSRGVGKVKLPRAISFTGALYSLGIPPEFIGTGRALQQAKEQGKLDLILKYYKYLKEDLDRAGRFLHKGVIEERAKKDKSFQNILADITSLEKIFGTPFGPVTKEEKEHHVIVGAINERLQHDLPIEELLEKAALLRHSLG